MKSNVLIFIRLTVRIDICIHIIYIYIKQNDVKDAVNWSNEEEAQSNANDSKERRNKVLDEFSFTCTFSWIP